MLNKIKFYLIGVCICCLVTGLYYTLKSNETPQAQTVAEYDYIEITNTFLSRVSKVWSLGELEGKYDKDKLNCPDFIQYNPLVAKRYLECNPRYLQCLFSQKSMEFDSFEFSLEKVISYRPTKIEFSLKHKTDSLIKPLSFVAHLKNTCHEASLSQGEYLLESLGKKSWSLSGREIFIDKFLVSQNEINMWKVGYQKEVQKWGLPALGLTLKDQKNFCKSQGKRLLTAHVFEAASRLKPSSKLSVYPWTHYSADSKEGLNKAEINQEVCSRSFLKECEERFLWRSFQGDSVSWAGVHDIFGGPPERFDNVYYPKLSLKMADRTVSMRNFSFARIGFKEQGSIADNEIGFRCYREVLQ